MKDAIRKCRFCGQDVAVITWGVYRKVVVDAAAEMVVADPEGEEFVRIDGSKIRGVEAQPGTLQTEVAYRPHRKSCEVPQ